MQPFSESSYVHTSIKAFNFWNINDKIASVKGVLKRIITHLITLKFQRVSPLVEKKYINYSESFLPSKKYNVFNHPRIHLWNAHYIPHPLNISTLLLLPITFIYYFTNIHFIFIHSLISIVSLKQSCSVVGFSLPIIIFF